MAISDATGPLPPNFQALGLGDVALCAEASCNVRPGQGSPSGICEAGAVAQSCARRAGAGVVASV